MSNPTKILVCILTMHERAGWVCKHLAEWIANVHHYSPGYLYQIVFAHNFIPAASARNYFCRNLKDAEPKPDWLLMIDNDMAPPPNLFDCVKDAPADASVIVPQFGMWDESKASVTLCWGMDESKIPLRDGRQFFTMESGQFYELTKCGTGAIFIKPEVFERITMPYFWYTYNSDMGLEGTEDINFCKKVTEAGLKIYGNSSMSVGHYHNVNLDVVAKAITQRSVDKAVNTCNKEVSASSERPLEFAVAEVSPTR